MYEFIFAKVTDDTRFVYKTLVGLRTVEDSKQAGTLLRPAFFGCPCQSLWHSHKENGIFRTEAVLA